jgi:hypothetical protein
MRSRKTAITFPVARTDSLLVENVGDETVVYDLQSKNAHCLKALASVVFTHADGRTSKDDLAALAEEQLGDTVTVANIEEALAQLEASSLLEVPLVIHDGLSRRDLVRKAGYAGATAAFAVPLITSIAAPTPAMAATQPIATGCAGCGKNSDCTSNHCCQNNGGKQCSQGCCVGANNSCHFCNCVGNTCQCTVTPADAGIPQCPCICGTAGCTGPCCVSVNVLCCTTAPAC